MHKLLSMTSSLIYYFSNMWPMGYCECRVCNFLKSCQITILILYCVYRVHVYIRFGICTLCPYVRHIHTLKVQQRVFFTDEFRQNLMRTMLICYIRMPRFSNCGSLPKSGSWICFWWASQVLK